MRKMKSFLRKGTLVGLFLLSALSLLAENHNEKIAFRPKVLWNKMLPSAETLSVGCWGDVSNQCIFVRTGLVLNVLDAAGKDIAKILLPEKYGHIEIAKSVRSPHRIIGYNIWDNNMIVIDKYGIGSFALIVSGVSCAKWCDIDGDGIGEIVVCGLNGLMAFTASGAEKWSKKIGNISYIATLPRDRGFPTRIFAEYGGTILQYGANGMLQKTINSKIGNGYFHPIGASRLKDGKTQLVAIETLLHDFVSLDLTGTSIWQFPASRVSAGTGHEVLFASGDIEGNGAVDWIFRDQTEGLKIVNEAGLIICEYNKNEQIISFSLLAQPHNGDLLIILERDAVKCVTFESL